MPAAARRTDSLPTTRGCAAVSGARKACRFGHAEADGVLQRSAAPRRSTPTRSASSACSSSDGWAPATSRRASSNRTWTPGSLRSAYASALDEDRSSHWTSSTAIRIGSRSLRSCNALRTATATARRSIGSPDASSTSNATSSARRLGFDSPGRTSSRTPSKRSPQPHVGETALGLRRSGREDAHSPFTRVLDPRKPERRLPDARLAFEYERSRPFLNVTDEGAEGRKLLLSADDLEHHLPCHDRDKLDRKDNLGRAVTDRTLKTARRRTIPAAVDLEEHSAGAPSSLRDVAGVPTHPFEASAIPGSGDLHAITSPRTATSTSRRRCSRTSS